jgi:hypothetical protein
MGTSEDDERVALPALVSSLLLLSLPQAAKTKIMARARDKEKKTLLYMGYLS